jgi:hypothetical protein
MVLTVEEGEEVEHQLVVLEQDEEEYIFETENHAFHFTILSDSVVEDVETGAQFQYTLVE